MRWQAAGNFHLIIDKTEQLQELCSRLRDTKVLGLDTEFYNSRTFYPVPCLYQIMDEQHCHLLDPLRLDDLSSFAVILRDQSIIKVLHSCRSDLMLFDMNIENIADHFFDSQVAAAFCGNRYQTSYAELVLKYFQINIPKTETMSNWRRRPLTTAQISYAEDDVRYLSKLYEILQEELTKTGRVKWYREEFQLLLQNAHIPEVDLYYKMSSKGKNLRGVELCRYQKLIAWREATARAKNIPRNWVIDDAKLYNFACQEYPQPEKIKKISIHEVRRYGSVLKSIWQQASDIDSRQWPEPALTFSMSTEMWKELKEYATKRAEHLNISFDLLIRKRLLNDLTASIKHENKITAPFNGWRYEVLGIDFFELIKTKLKVL